jgi:beta-1,4-mannosyltransferase
VAVQELKQDAPEWAAASRVPATSLRLARFPPARHRNPYLRLLYDELRRFGVEFVAEPGLTFGWLWRSRQDIDVLHFHWRPDRYYAWRRPKPDELRHSPRRFQGVRSWRRLLGFAARLRAARVLGYTIAWTIHEVFPPGNSWSSPGAAGRRIDRIGSRLLARRCDLLLTHDVATKERARSALGRPAEHAQVVEHGSYLGVYPPGRSRAEVRCELGIPPSAFTFLCFGALRPDKSIDLVLGAFCSIENPNLALVVAGDPEDAHSRGCVLAAAAVDARVKPVLRFIPHDDVRELFEAADAAVLGRSEVWTSGSLILSLSLGLPVVAAALAPNNELLDDGRAGWLFRPGDVESLRARLEAAAANPDAARAKGAAAIRQAERLPSWSEIAARTAALMLSAANGRRNGRRRPHG